MTKQKRDKVWVCRGCCCGTTKKHPGIDHKGLEKQARKGAKQVGAAYSVTDCLGPCGQGNIVVTRVDGTIRWFRKVNSESLTADVIAQVRDDRLTADLDRLVMAKRQGKRPKG